MRLRGYGLVTGNMAVAIRYRDSSKWKQTVEITPTQDTVQLTNALSKVLENRPPNASDPRRVSIALTKLYYAEATPLPLFGNTGPAREKLNDGLDKLNTKYGKNTIYMGTSWNAKKSAPMRIAFHHIPDLETDEDDPL